MQSEASGPPSGPRVAVVTGAAAGLGAAYATRLAELGYDVGICDPAPCHDTLEAIREADRRAFGYRGDVSDPGDVEAFAHGVGEELGVPNVVVNNAGISPYAPFEQLRLEEWRRVMAVNLDGLFLVTRAFLDGMKAQGWGRVINITSALTADAQRRDVTAYVTSKMGVLGFTRALAAELGEYGITVNAISPGIISTPVLQERLAPQQWEAYIERQSIKRVGKPRDLLGALSLLVSKEADFITAVNLPVHGGRVWL